MEIRDYIDQHLGDLKSSGFIEFGHDEGYEGEIDNSIFPLLIHHINRMYPWSLFDFDIKEITPGVYSLVVTWIGKRTAPFYEKPMHRYKLKNPKS